MARLQDAVVVLRTSRRGPCRWDPEVIMAAAMPAMTALDVHFEIMSISLVGSEKLTWIWPAAGVSGRNSAQSDGLVAVAADRHHPAAPTGGFPIHRATVAQPSTCGRRTSHSIGAASSRRAMRGRPGRRASRTGSRQSRPVCRRQNARLRVTAQRRVLWLRTAPEVVTAATRQGRGSAFQGVAGWLGDMFWPHK